MDLTLITAGVLAPGSGPPFWVIFSGKAACPSPGDPCSSLPAGGPDDGAKTLSPAVGTAVAGICLLAVAPIVGYGLWIIIA